MASSIARGLALEWLSLGQRLLLLVLAVAVPLNVLSFAAIAYQIRHSLEVHRANLFYAARAIASAVDAELDTYVALGEVLARSPALSEDKMDTFELDARRALPSLGGASVVVANLEGLAILNLAVVGEGGSVRRAPLALEAQRRAIETRSTVVSDVHLSAGTRKWVISINVPVMRNNVPFRILAINVPAASFLQLLNPARLPSYWLAGIIDRGGRFVTRVPGHEKHVGQLASAGWRKVMDRDGVFEFHSLEGEPIVQGNAHAHSWTIGIAARKPAMEAAAWSASRPAILMGVGLSGLSLLMAALVARTISRPLHEVRDKAKALLAGSSAALTSRAPEARELWSALQEAVRDRRRSESRFLHTFANAGVGMAHLELDGRWITVNDRLCTITGYSREELLTKRWQELTNPVDIAADLAKEKELLAGAISSYTVEKRYIRKDGATIWVAITVSLARTMAGEPDYLISVVRDVTVRKQAEEHNRLLLREINHRSKNLLSVILAVARHTSAASPAEFVERFSERVQALARGQDVLIHNDWKGVTLQQLIQGQLSHLMDLFGTRIELSGPVLAITPVAAQAIGMALHELATNASKYGALSNKDGRVRISWSLEGNQFAMTWSEEGGPPVHSPSRRGFGTTVIVDMVMVGLDAEVNFELLPEGLRWGLSCPAENVRFVS